MRNIQFHNTNTISNLKLAKMEMLNCFQFRCYVDKGLQSLDTAVCCFNVLGVLLLECRHLYTTSNELSPENITINRSSLMPVMLLSSDILTVFLSKLQNTIPCGL